jgi:signal peptidase I
MRSTRWVETLLTSGSPSRRAWVILSGGSMAPAYRDGDWLLLEPVSAGATVRPGEVVVARRGPLLVTHRVVSLQNGLLVTKGDSCTRPDPPIAADALLGRVVGVRRSPGFFMRLRRLRHAFLSSWEIRHHESVR